MTLNNATEPTSQLREEIHSGLIQFLEARTKQPVEPDQDLFASGLVSSLFAMELVVQMESSYGIAIVGSDLKLENFRTVRRMADLALRLKAEDDGVVDGG